jgi:TctA family transporter
MDTPVLVAFISPAAAVIVPALSFYLTKKKEREADWQRAKFELYKERAKFELYKELVLSLSGIVGLIQHRKEAGVSRQAAIPCT